MKKMKNELTQKQKFEKMKKLIGNNDEIEEMIKHLKKYKNHINSYVLPNSKIQHYFNCQLDGFIDLIGLDLNMNEELQDSLIPHINEYLLKVIFENYFKTYN